MRLAAAVRELLENDSANYGYDSVSGTAIIARQLTAMKAKPFDIIKRPLKGAILVPQGDITDNAAEVFGYEQMDIIGQAKVIADYSSDLTRVDVSGQEILSPIRSTGCAYGYSIQEMRAAARVGGRLSAKRPAAAARAYNELSNKIIFYGAPKHGLRGWMTIPNVPTVTAAATGNENGATNSVLWENKTPDQVVKDFTNLIGGIETRTGDTHMPTAVAISSNRYIYIRDTRMGSGDGSLTILQHLQRLYPGITFEKAFEFQESERQKYFDTDPFTGELMCAYERDEDKFFYEEPQGFEQLPEQAVNLEIKVPCHSRHAGVASPYPLSMAFMEGF